MSERPSADELRQRLVEIQRYLGKERDKLRKVIDEAESLAEDCAEAIDAMEVAADALSKLQ